MNNIISEVKLQQAYKQQKEFVKQKTADGISGFKAAVSSKQAQKNMGLSIPLTGVLYASGELQSGATLTLADFASLKIETEIGYRLGQEITKITTASDAQKLVKDVLPVLEIPDNTFSVQGQEGILKMLSENLFTSHYVVGSPLKVGSVDVNSIEIVLYKNKKSIGTGKATDAMNNQWEALASAINQTLAKGYELNEDDIIITGALGQILILEEGHYIADYGILGKVELFLR